MLGVELVICKICAYYKGVTDMLT